MTDLYFQLGILIFVAVFGFFSHRKAFLNGYEQGIYDAIQMGKDYQKPDED